MRAGAGVYTVYAIQLWMCLFEVTFDSDWLAAVYQFLFIVLVEINFEVLYATFFLWAQDWYFWNSYVRLENTSDLDPLHHFPSFLLLCFRSLRHLICLVVL